MRVTFVRHTEVEEKYQNCYNGHIDISLSKKGLIDAKVLGKELADKRFDLIYCSDLKRAKETLHALSRKEPVIYSANLREKSWGRHEGMSFEQIVEKEHIEYENFLQWVDALDGDSYETFIARVKEFFFKVLLLSKAKDILVVTHAGVIRAFISIIENKTLEEAFTTELPYGSSISFNLDANSKIHLA